MSTNRAKALKNFVNVLYLQRRMHWRCAMEDLNVAIATSKSAADSHPERALCMNNLINLQRRFERTGAMEVMNGGSIATNIAEVVDILSKHPNRAAYLNNLGEDNSIGRARWSIYLN